MVHGDTIADNMGWGGLVNWGSFPRITECVFRGNEAGIHLGSIHLPTGGAAAKPLETCPVSGRRFADFARRDSPDSVIVERSVFTGNASGIRQDASDGGPLRVSNSSIDGNVAWGIVNSVATPVIDARRNWWGDATGPGGEGPGTGDAISGRIDCIPWITGATDVAESNRPDATAWNNGRKMVRDEAPPFYRIVYTDQDGVFVIMTNDPAHGPWLGPVEVWPVELVHHSDGPALAIERCDPAGCEPPSKLHLVWSEHIPDESSPGEIYYATSGDGGHTWSQPVDLSQSATPSQHPSIAVDGHGVVHVAWEEWGTFSPEILYRSNSGAGWSPPLNVSRTGQASMHPCVAANYAWEWGMPPTVPDDRVHLAWTEFSPGPGEPAVPWIAYRSFDPADGWVPPLALIPEDASAGRGGAFASLIAFPDVTIAGRTPAIAWQSPYDPSDPPSAPSDIYFNDRRAGTWGVPRPVSHAPGPAESPSRWATLAPRTGAIGDTLWIAWEEWRSPGRSDIDIGFSPDMGAHWQFWLTATQAENDRSCHPGFAFQKGVNFEGPLDLVWTEVSSIGPGIRSRVCCLGLTSLSRSIYSAVAGTPASRVSPLIATAIPNPATGQLDFAVSVTKAAWIEVAVYDVRGRLVNRLRGEAAGPGTSRIHWDLTAAGGERVPSGLYHCRIRAAGTEVVERIAVLR